MVRDSHSYLTHVPASTLNVVFWDNGKKLPPQGVGPGTQTFILFPPAFIHYRGKISFSPPPRVIGCSRLFHGSEPWIWIRIPGSDPHHHHHRSWIYLFHAERTELATQIFMVMSPTRRCHISSAVYTQVDIKGLFTCGPYEARCTSDAWSLCGQGLDVRSLQSRTGTASGCVAGVKSRAILLLVCPTL